MPTLVERLRAKASRFYAINDRLGVKSRVFRGTLTWDGEVGETPPEATSAPVLPTPSVTNLKVRRQLSGHGETGEGDLMLRGLAWNNFDREYFSNGGEKDGKVVQNFWLIGGQTYTTLSIEEKYSSWSVSVKLHKTNHWETFDLLGDTI